jgi:hypothetical protein
MKLQFSLATLLVCVTVLAVVCAVAVGIPVSEIVQEYPKWYSSSPIKPYNVAHPRPPTTSEIASRLALWGPPALAATLGALWVIRRLKSRRENGPPVG